MENRPSNRPSGPIPVPGRDARQPPGAPGSTPGAGGSLRFGRFVFDPGTGELTRGGAPVRLPAQPARVLGILLRRPGALVTREAIQREVWGSGTYVDFDQGINHCIRRIRSVLGDGAGTARYLETIPRMGYRFIAPVERVPATEAEPSSSGAVAGEAPGAGAGRWWKAGIVAIALLGAALALTLGSRSGGDPGAAPSGSPRLVVLPFANLGVDVADDRLGHAITEELITQLGQQYSGRLGVIARTSAMRYVEPTRTVAEIGRELDVDYVLEGSIRRSGSLVRFTAQLIRARDEVHLWAANYDRASADVLAVQQEIGERIAQALALNILPAPDRQKPGASTSPEAYERYLRGRALIREHRGVEAAAVLEEAMRLDPGFAPVHAALTLAYQSGPDPYPVKMERARRAAERGLALDDQLAEAHLALANILFYYDHDREAARASFERALQAHPGYAEAHHDFAAYYSVLGRHEEALAEVRAAQALDPLSPSVNSDVGWYYFFARRYDDAVRESVRTLEISPNYYWANRCLLLSYLQQGRLDEAAAQARREMRAAGAESALPARRAASDDDVIAAYLDWDLERKRRAVAAHRAGPAALAELHVLRREHPQAIEQLEAAVETRVGWILPFLAIHPTFDRLRGDPRFDGVVARIEERSRPVRAPETQLALSAHP